MADAFHGMIMKRQITLPALFALCALALPAAAAETVPAGASTCEVIDRSSTVVLMLCPPGLPAEALREAGSAACLMRTHCNVWIWADRQQVPQKAPAVQADLPESARRHAVAIWVNESQSVVTLRRVPR